MSEQSGGKRVHLGRGLAALLGDDDLDEPGPEPARGARTISIDRLLPNPFQPRRDFDEDALGELVESVRRRGILQPLVVRPHPDRADAFEIVAGERRWRAAQRAGLHEVPVTVRVLDDRDVMEIALIENVQRESLSPIEEAEGYQRLLDEFSYTQDQLAQAVGKSRPHITNTLRLLVLPGDVRAMVGARALSAGHARALIGSNDPTALARQVVRRGLSVRQTEKLAQRDRAGTARRPAGPSVRDADTVALEHDLSELLGLRVNLAVRGEAGALTIHYETLDQLDDLLARLRRPRPAAKDDDDGILDLDTPYEDDDPDEPLRSVRGPGGRTRGR